MSEQYTFTLKLSADEVVLLEEVLQDYKDRLRHEAQLDLDLLGDKESAQMHLKQAGVIDQLRHKVTRCQIE